MRQLAGVGSFSFTGSATAGTIISASHVTDLRTALDAARGPLGFSTGSYTNSSLAGVFIKAVHELRDRVE